MMLIKDVLKSDCFSRLARFADNGFNHAAAQWLDRNSQACTSHYVKPFEFFAHYWTCCNPLNLSTVRIQLALIAFTLITFCIYFNLSWFLLLAYFYSFLYATLCES